MFDEEVRKELKAERDFSKLSNFSTAPDSGFDCVFLFAEFFRRLICSLSWASFAVAGEFCVRRHLNFYSRAIEKNCY